MEMEKNYTLREIILGLRKEFLLYQKKLIELKELCEADENLVSDYTFRVCKFDKPQIVCYCDPKTSLFFQKILSLIKKIHYIYTTKPMAFLEPDGHFDPITNKWHISIKNNLESQEKFYQLVTDILTSKISYYATNEYIEYLGAVLNIVSPDIGLHFLNHEIFSGIFFSYYADEDIFRIISHEKEVNVQDIEDMLNIFFPSSQLNSYLIETITNNEIDIKPIEITESTIFKKASFDIREEEKKYVLSRIK